MLSDTKLRALKPKDKPYRVSDERGLYVQVATSGSRLWRFKYTFEGKEKLLALGQYPDVPLSLARERREEARQLLARGIDPSAQKKAVRQGDGTFAALFEEWLARQKDVLTDSTWANKKQRMETNALPYLGHLPPNEITAQRVLQVVQRIEARGLGETARRVTQIIGQVMRYAVATGRAEIDPTPSLRGALKPVVVKHRAAITDKALLGAFLRAVDAYPASPIVRAAMQLQTLLFLRPGELRQLEWSFIDWTLARIKIPGALMKMREDHLVPLARQSLHILQHDLQPLTGSSRYVLPSPRSIGGDTERPMSENGVLVALRVMGFDRETVTGHGFRATARTFLDEELRIRPEVIEAQLAHAVRDPLGRAYNRTKHIEERTEMMQAWADWLDGVKEGRI